MYDRYQAQALKTRLRIPHPLRRRRRARPQQRDRRRDLPAQHRLGATRDAELVEEIGAHHRRRGAGHRHPVDVRALRGRACATSAGAAPTRASARTRSWWPSSARRRCAACRARASTIPLRVLGLRQALRRRRRHGLGHGHALERRAGRALPARPGRHALDEADAAPAPPARLRHRDRGRRRLDHAVLQQLERREVLGQQAAAHRHPEGRAGLRGLPDLRLQRASTSSPATTAATIKQSINAGMDMVMVPDKLPRVLRHAARAWWRRARCRMARIDDAVLRILRVKFAMGLLRRGPLAAGRPRACTRASAPPSTATWRAARCASRWCC